MLTQHKWHTMAPICLYVWFFASGILMYAHAAPVDEVVQFAQNAATVSVENAENLLEALRSGDSAQAQAAYLKLRPEYEQIEHLYEVFGDTDADIDARPDAYTYGEAYDANQVDAPGSIFKGSHRIETLLYRDDNVTAAVPWAEQLVEDYKTLVTKLEDPTQYSDAQILSGLITVAYEVAFKKFSSEEETWSDQSILIFYNNLEGIIQMIKPYQEQLAASSPQVSEALQSHLDRASATLAPFVTTLEDGSRTYAAYSTVPIDARAAIQAEFYHVATHLEEAAAALGIELPEEGEEEDACTPTVSAMEYAGDSPQIQEGLDYFRALLRYSLNASRAFTQAVEAGDLEGTKAAYLATRPLYEQIEVLAVSFPDVDEALDAREYAYPNGELSEDWRGYHRVERLIFRDGKVDEETLRYARQIEQSHVDLEEALNNPDNFSGALSMEGILGLATEVPAKKISSEEETSSDLSLMIYYNNWKGILSQLLPFCSLAQEDCDAVVAAAKNAANCLDIEIQDTIENVSASDVTPEFINNLLTADYKAYSQASVEQRRCIVQQGYAVRDAAAKMANTLQLVDDCSPYYAARFLTYPEGTATA